MVTRKHQNHQRQGHQMANRIGLGHLTTVTLLGRSQNYEILTFRAINTRIFTYQLFVRE